MHRRNPTSRSTTPVSSAAAAFAGLANLGPASAAMLQAARIANPAQLRALGAVAAYDRVCRSGARPSLNLLWALEGALTGQRWQDVARDERTSLLLALDALQHADATGRAHGGRRR